MAEICSLCTTKGGQGFVTERGNGFRCPRCGAYSISGTAQATIVRIPLSRRAGIWGWVQDRNAIEDVPYLDDQTIAKLADADLPDVMERADRYIRFVVAKQVRLADPFNRTNPELIGVTYSSDGEDVRYLSGLLQELDYVELRPNSDEGVVRPKGYMRYEELRTRGARADQAFVAMWFDASMNNAFGEGIAEGVRRAGYVAVRVDALGHNEKVDDRIIAEIRKSRFVVVDFTGQRQSVYFEAGFALGLNLPVIWTCRQDDIENLRFDTRQYNCIGWESAEDLATRLHRRIEAILGRGPQAGV